MPVRYVELEGSARSEVRRSGESYSSPRTTAVLAFSGPETSSCSQSATHLQARSSSIRTLCNSYGSRTTTALLSFRRAKSSALQYPRCVFSI